MEKDQKTIALEWLDLSIKNFQDEIRRLKIKQTDDLYNSFKGTVIGGANGDPLKISLAYKWYGQMVDMGVGRGTKKGDQKDNATERRLIGKGQGNGRRPKQWFSKGKNGIGYQVHRLGILLGNVHADYAAEVVADTLEVKENIKFS